MAQQTGGNNTGNVEANEMKSILTYGDVPLRDILYQVIYCQLLIKNNIFVYIDHTHHTK